METTWVINILINKKCFNQRKKLFPNKLISIICILITKDYDAWIDDEKPSVNDCLLCKIMEWIHNYLIFCKSLHKHSILSTTNDGKIILSLHN